MKNKFLYRVFILSVFIILIGIGIFLGYRYTDKNYAISDYDNMHSNEENKTVEVYVDEDEIEAVSTKSYDIEVVYIDYYTLCGEKEVSSNIYYGANIDELKESEKAKQEKEKKEYRIKEERIDKIVYERMVETNCPNHFKVILEKDKINIYSVISNEKLELFKQLDVPTDTLRTEVKNELIGGILINSKEELNSIIEDIES